MLALLFVAVIARAAPDAGGLLPTAIARPLLERDASVASARAALEAAKAEAGILERSPYEWTARVSGQRRSLDSGSRFNEWNAAVEKPWRLPGKAAADASLATATVEEGEARLRGALHAVSRELVSMWLDWLGAENARELGQSMRAASQANLHAVQKRLRAGDASRLDVSLAQGELAEQRRLANETETQAKVAWARLQARFPSLERMSSHLPRITPSAEAISYWRDRILEQSDELRIARAQWRMASAQLDRARAERMPDPTFGLFASSEFGGQERVVGVTVSIPIPDGQRSRRADRAVYTAEAARQEVEQKRRLLEVEVAASVAAVEGAFEGVKLAEDGSVAMQESAQLAQKAYSLGESDLQSLLTARRQAAMAAQAALVARVAALKAYYLLLVDGYLVWDLAND